MKTKEVETQKKNRKTLKKATFPHFDGDVIKPEQKIVEQNKSTHRIKWPTKYQDLGQSQEKILNDKITITLKQQNHY